MYRLDCVNIPTGVTMSEDFLLFEDLEDALFEQVDLCCKTGMVSNMEEAYSLASMCTKPEMHTDSNAMSLHDEKHANALLFIAKWTKL